MVGPIHDNAVTGIPSSSSSTSTALVPFHDNTLVLFVVYSIPARFCFAKLTPSIIFLRSSLHTMKVCLTLLTPNIKVKST